MTSWEGRGPEANLRQRVVRIARAHDWLVFSLPIARTRRPVKDAVGYPDLTLARRGVVLWIELKAGSNGRTLAQNEWAAALPASIMLRDGVTDDYLRELLA